MNYVYTRSNLTKINYTQHTHTHQILICFIFFNHIQTAYYRIGKILFKFQKYNVDLIINLQKEKEHFFLTHFIL